MNEDGPYAVVWEYGPMIYLHEWANNRLGEQLDARLLADHLLVRSVHAAALEWLVAPEPDEHDEEFDDDDEGVPDASRTLVGVGGQDGEEHAFVATMAVRGPYGQVYLHRDDRFECVRCDAAVLDWPTPARTETCTGRSETPVERTNAPGWLTTGTTASGEAGDPGTVEKKRPPGLLQW